MKIHVFGLFCILYAIVACSDDPSSTMPSESDLRTIDTSSTPRSDEDAEVLSFEAANTYVAPDELYMRVSGELDVIRSEYPDIGTITSTPYEPDSLFISLTESASELYQADNYHEWDEYNAVLRVTEVDFDSDTRFGSLFFDGRYNIPLVAQDYEDLSGVEFVLIGSTEPSRDMCLEIRGTLHRYIVVHGYGDCPSGCQGHTWYGFDADEDGGTTLLGEFTIDRSNPEMPDQVDEEPLWYSEADKCRQFLSR